MNWVIYYCIEISNDLNYAKKGQIINLLKIKHSDLLELFYFHHRHLLTIFMHYRWMH